MRTDWLWKASTLTLAGALVLVSASGESGAAPTVGVDAEQVSVEGGQAHMQAALDALSSAKNQLEKATHDKGGHRAKALGLTKEAIEQVKKGIAFDKEHDGDKKAE